MGSNIVFPSEVYASHPQHNTRPMKSFSEGKTETRVVTKPDMISSSINLTISRAAFLGLWCFVFVVALLNGLFLLASAYMYLATDDGDGYTMLGWLSENFLYSVAIAFLRSNSKAIGISYLLPALPFWGCCFYLTWQSVRARRLSFGARASAEVDNSTKRKSWLRQNPRSVRSRSPSLTDCIKKLPPVGRFMKLSEVLEGIGIRGKYFEQALLGMETVEIVLQTIQAYRYSRSISSRFVNAWCGSIILVNCWSGPVIHHLTSHFGQNVLMERLLHVLMDQLLDFLWGPAFQLFLLWPYISLFHAWTINHDVFAAFDKQKSAETAERELMQIFASSWRNYGLNIFSYVTSALILFELCTLLQEAEQSFITTRGISVSNLLVTNNVSTSSRSILHILAQAVKAFFCVYGLAILVISLSSARFFSPTDESLAFCQNRVYPWFTTKDSCVGRQINCTANGIIGRRNEIRAAIDAIDPTLVAKLEFRDCPALEIPPDITQFHAIGNLQLINVTLRSWETDAAISNSVFPQLKTLQIKYSTIACIPYGIFHEHLPKAFEWISFREINANTFLHLVGDTWSNVIYFYCRYCGLTSVPEIVKSMYRLNEVELSGNSITHVTIDEIGGSNSQVDFLVLDNNPMTALPDEIWAMACLPLSYISLQITNVSAVNEVVGRQCVPAGFWLLMYNTPVCLEPPAWLKPLVNCREY